MLFDISDKFNFLFKKSFTNLSFALTIMVSNKESSLLKLLRILITGNLIFDFFKILDYLIISIFNIFRFNFLFVLK